MWAETSLYLHKDRRTRPSVTVVVIPVSRPVLLSSRFDGVFIRQSSCSPRLVSKTYPTETPPPPYSDSFVLFHSFTPGPLSTGPGRSTVLGLVSGGPPCPYPLQHKGGGRVTENFTPSMTNRKFRVTHTGGGPTEPQGSDGTPSQRDNYFTLLT